MTPDKEKATMIAVRITMQVVPEKQLEFVQTVLSILEPTRQEEGCLNCGIFCDIENDGLFSLLAEWENREALEHHIESQRFSVLLGAKILLRRPPSIQIHAATDLGGMELVDTARRRRTHS